MDHYFVFKSEGILKNKEQYPYSLLYEAYKEVEQKNQQSSASQMERDEQFSLAVMKKLSKCNNLRFLVIESSIGNHSNAREITNSQELKRLLREEYIRQKEQLEPKKSCKKRLRSGIPSSEVTQKPTRSKRRLNFETAQEPISHRTRSSSKTKNPQGFIR